ncbi:MAG: VOC family protein [Acidobacteriaceae bacterium]
MTDSTSFDIAQGAGAVVNFHHVCLVVKDMDEALKLYRDVLGMSVYIDAEIPDPGQVLFPKKTLDDIFHLVGAKSRMVMLVSVGGSKVELQQPSVPQVIASVDAPSGYGRTGIKELALRVTAIDDWFHKVRAAGYKTQTDYVWSVGDGRLRSFLFYDSDGSLIQLCEDAVVASAAS